MPVIHPPTGYTVHLMTLTWKLETREFPLKYTWKISRNSSDRKQLFFVGSGDGAETAWGEVAYNMRYKETPALIASQFELFCGKFREEYGTPAALPPFLEELNLCNALRFGIESAFLHFWSKKKNIPLDRLLGAEPPAARATAYSIPIMDPAEICSFFKRENLQRFAMIKMKIDAENGKDLLRTIRKYSEQPLIVDANEAWKDVEALIRFLEIIKKENIPVLEQPLPDGMKEEYIYLKKYSPFPVFADESVTDTADFSLLSRCFHGVNMKLMKAGGYLNGVRILKEAGKAGLRTMIGCMVETSLGISSALQVAPLAEIIDLDGFMVLKEDPFRLVTEEEGKLTAKNPCLLNRI